MSNANKKISNKGVNMKEDIKKAIADLCNKIKQEVSPELQAELEGSAAPQGAAEFVDWHEKIDELDLNDGQGGIWQRFGGNQLAQIRTLLHRIADLSRTIGGKAVKYGKRIIKWIFTLIGQYPATMRAIVVMSALAFLVSCIPLLHFVLLPIVKVVALGLVGFVFLQESFANMTVVNIANG